MREVLDKGKLHATFVEALRRHPDGANGEFVFEINERPVGPGGCNWYPLATIEGWRGDLLRNLNAFRQVHDELAARCNVVATSGATLQEAAPV